MLNIFDIFNSDIEPEDTGVIESNDAESTSFDDDPLSQELSSIVPDEGDNVSFGAYKVDYLYEPKISEAKEHFIIHSQQLERETDVNKIKVITEMLKKDAESISYWEEAKSSARMDEDRDSIFWDHLKRQEEIIEKYR